MSLEKLKQEVLSQAEEQSEAALKRAREEEGKILGEAREKAKALVSEARERGKSQAKELALELRASAMIQAKRIESEAKEDVVDQVMREIRRNLVEEAGSRKYEQVFESLARQAIRALGDKDFVLKTNARDRKLGAEFGTVSETIETIGGVIVAKRDGSIQINNTFEALLEENEEKLKQEIFEELFAKRHSHPTSHASNAGAGQHHPQKEVRKPAPAKKAGKSKRPKAPKKAGKKSRGKMR